MLAIGGLSCEIARVDEGALAFAVYAFEGALPELASPPIAARRALDHAGVRLSTEAWRSLAYEPRVALTVAGASERVEVAAVVMLTDAAMPAPARVEPRLDPSRDAPPELVQDVPGWRDLRGLDRYAFWFVRTRAAARSSFGALAAEEADIRSLALAAPRTQDLESIVEPSATEPESIELTGRDVVSVRPSSALFDTDPLGEELDDPVSSMGNPEGGFPKPLQVSSMGNPDRLVSTHLTEAGEVHMVDVGAKAISSRRAVARGLVRMRAETLARLARNETPKGEVLGTARIAGILAAKRTPEIVPLCHHVALTHVEVTLALLPAEDEGVVVVTATVDAMDRTGCEMEALVAVSAACLTVYDMLKGIDREMQITDIVLLEKRGGRSGHYERGPRGEGAP